MKTYINVLIIFVFLIIYIYFNIININDDNILKNKLFLFIGLFICQVIILSINKIKNKCTNITINDIIKDGSLTSLYGIIAYELYYDLINIEQINNSIGTLLNNNNIKISFMTFVISILIGFFKLCEFIINYKNEDCSLD